MKNQLSSFYVITAKGGYLVSYTFDKLNEEGDFISENNKKSFFALDEELREHIEWIGNYISSKKLDRLEG